MQDPILFWNAAALELNRRDHSGPAAPRHQRGPTLSSRALAIIHLAIHDAYVLSRQGLAVPGALVDAYLPPTRRPVFAAKPGLDAAGKTAYSAIAVAAAATTTMLNLYPAQRGYIDAQFAEFCAMWGSDTAAHRFGGEVGRALLNLRRNDGAEPDARSAAPDYFESAARGRHREDPANRGQGFLGTRYGQVRPFAVTEFHPLNKHPELDTPAYLTDLNEVIAKGAASGYPDGTRDVDETLVGVFWAYDGVNEIGTPPRLYNQMIRKVIENKGLSTEQLARLFMLVNVAMGDAGIHAWFYKYEFDLWRPVVGVREHDVSMGPATTQGGVVNDASPCDPFWRALGAPKTNPVAADKVGSFTPPFPAYPSGHATFGAAAFHVARLYLQGLDKAVVLPNGNDNLTFSFVSDELNGHNIDPDGSVRTRHSRSFAGLHQAIYENSVSRVFLGVHWRFDGTTGTSVQQMFANASDNIGGVPLGLAIANDLFTQSQARAIRPSSDDVVAPAFSTQP